MLEKKGNISLKNVLCLQAESLLLLKLGTSQDAVENLDELRSVEDQVIDQLNEKGMKVNPSEISATHTLKSRKMIDKTKPNIIIRFSSRKSKGSIMKRAKDVKLGNHKIYVSEHLRWRNANRTF